MPAIFISLPSTDLARSTRFFEAVGLRRNPPFSDHNAVCFIVEEDHSYLMVLTREFLQTFTDLPIGDQATNPTSSISIFLDSREAVDDTAAAGIAAGGSEPREAADYGFMYQRGINDPDGNPFEFGWMDPAVLAEGPAAFAADHAAGGSTGER